MIHGATGLKHPGGNHGVEMLYERVKGMVSVWDIGAVEEDTAFPIFQDKRMNVRMRHEKSLILLMRNVP